MLSTLALVLASITLVQSEVDPAGFGLGFGLGAGWLQLPAPIASVDVGYRFGNSYGVDALLEGGLFRLGEYTYGGADVAVVGTFRLVDHRWSPVVGVGPTLGWATFRGSDFTGDSPFAGGALLFGLRVPMNESVRVDVTLRGNATFPLPLSSGWITFGLTWLS